MAGSRRRPAAAAVSEESWQQARQEEEKEKKQQSTRDTTADGDEEEEEDNEEEGEGNSSRRKLLQKQRAELRTLAAEWKQAVRKAKTRSERRSAEESFSKREAALLQRHREEHQQQQQRAEQQQGTTTQGEAKEEEEVQGQQNRRRGSQQTRDATAEGKGEDAATDAMQRAFASLNFYKKGGEDGEPTAAATRAQKRREKKKAAAAARELQLQQELENCPMLGRIEWEQLSSALSQQQLQIHLVAADGHCLYRAVCHQLSNPVNSAEAAGAGDAAPAAAAAGAPAPTNRSTAPGPQQHLSPEQRQRQGEDRKENAGWSVTTLRARVADFLMTQREQFSPFLGEAAETAAGFADYCERIRSTAEWGGELELQLIASLLRRRIEVSSVSNGEYSKLVYGEEFTNDTAPLRLTYHRHLLAAGGHYNSTSALKEDETAA